MGPRAPARARRTDPVQARRMTRARHRRPAPLAPAGGRPVAAGRLRPRLRVRRPRPDDHPALPRRAATTTAPTSTAAASRTARGCCARSSRTRSRSSPAGRRSPAGSASTSWSATAASSAARSRACSGCVGELPDVWDFMVGEWDFDSITSRFAEEGVAGAVRARSEALTIEAGGRRRPVHLAGHDGADGARRRARHDRLGPAVDRRPVPARRRSRRGAGRTSASASAATSASPATSPMTPIRCTQNPSMGEEWRRGWHPERIRPRATRRAGARGGRRAGRPRGGAWRSASAATRWCWPRRRGELGGRVAARGAAARPGGLDPRARLPQAASWSGCATSSSAFGSELTADEIASLRVRPRRRRHRRALAGRRGRPLAHPPDRRSTRACRC